MTAANSRPATGVIVSLIGVAVLTAFAGWVPAQVRKLGLFSIAYGVAVASIVILSAREFSTGLRVVRPLFVLLTIIGLTVIALMGHRRLEQERVEAARESPEHAMAINMLESAAADDPEMAAELADLKRRMQPTFADYLAVRTQPLGRWDQPWPMVFWGSEIILACVAGLFVIQRMSKIEEAAETDSEGDEATA